ncbi:MAG: DUF4091 domain-containing protein [Bacteroidales bacterium]|nr:DUF4091 domain-containing protein [Bacteroidales bacterium]
MKRFLLLLSFFFLQNLLSPVGAQPDLNELPDPKPGPQEAWNNIRKPLFVWGSTDVRYARHQVPSAEKAPVLYAWKGERVSVQAVFVAPEDMQISVEASDLRCGSQRIPAACVQPSFVHYVMTDHYGNRNDSFLMADRLDPEPQCKVAGHSVRPLWLSVRVPRDAAAGKYQGSIRVSYAGGVQELSYTLIVSQRSLPEPKDWKFHLDLWQNPYAVARYFDVPLWSEEHFQRLRPLMEAYAEAGGKVITTSIMQHPWNSQTEDPFESMVLKMKNIDGSWSYNYQVFDRWVEFMFSCGVTEQIDCYTIVPWGYTFEYLDMASGTLKHIACKPGEKAYEDYILPFLTDFAKHLKTKGWFERTCIAMDERPMDQFRAAFEIVRRADPGFRVKGAVNYSPEIEKLVPLMYDISLIYDHAGIPAQVVDTRRNSRLRTTFYTCCAPDRPNTFTFSPPAEATWLGIHAAALGFDGYLRWAYNSWVKNPCTDSRFRKWYGGDCYLVYPTGSSLRFERLVQGIQDFEKIRMLMENANPAQAKKLQALLAPFRHITYDPRTNAAAAVRRLEAGLRKME